MSQQALYRKWRSRTFDEVIGQPHIVRTLHNALDTERVAHAYIFSGPRGVGKTSTARILAKAVNCLAPEGERPCNTCPVCRSINDGSLMDLIEIDAASNTQVDKVRDVIVEKVNFAPSEARKKVYIIDEVHMLSNSAFNALLKTIEEPPPHAMFVLATTEIHKVPATILSRCQRLDFRRIGVEEIAEHLSWVLAQENLAAEPEVLDLIARQATGSMRDALSLLDQLLAHGGTRLTLVEARAALGLATTEAVQTLVDFLLAQETAGALALVNRLLDQGTDPRQFLVDVLEHLRALLLTLAGGDKQLLNLPTEAMARLQTQKQYVDAAALIEVIRRFNGAMADLKLGLQPQLPLELAVVESVLALQARGATPAPPPEELLPDEPPRKAAPRDVPAEAKAPSQATPPAPLAEDERDSDASPTPDAGTPTAERPKRRQATRRPRRAAPPVDAPAEAGPPPPPPFWEEDGFIAPPPTQVRERRPDPEPAAPPAPTNGQARSLDWWQAQWETFQEFLTQQGTEGHRAALRLKFCAPHALDGPELILGFFYTIHMEKIQGTAERAVVERALATFSGDQVTVRCVLVPKDQPPQTHQTKYEAAAADPVVKEALQQGGRLVEVYEADSP